MTPCVSAGAQPGPAEGLDSLRQLADIVARLRGPQGCPWDREQTLQSLVPGMIEETYETIDAIESGDAGLHKEELGDLLLQVVMQAQIRREQGAFELGDVAAGVCEKLIRRHPHVFGDAKAADSGEVLKNWERIKAGERRGEGKSLLDGVPRHLPALLKAEKVQVRAARVGFDWKCVGDVLAKLEEEVGELRAAIARKDARETEEEAGDLLFAAVNLCRFLHIQAEGALDKAVLKFKTRFRDVERRLHAQGRSLSESSLDEMDALWNQVKADERRAAAEEKGC